MASSSTVPRPAAFALQPAVCYSHDHGTFFRRLLNCFCISHQSLRNLALDRNIVQVDLVLVLFISLFSESLADGLSSRQSKSFQAWSRQAPDRIRRACLISARRPTFQIHSISSTHCPYSGFHVIVRHTEVRLSLDGTSAMKKASGTRV